MNKAELVSAIAKRADVPASTVDSVIDGLREELVEAITRGDKVADGGKTGFCLIKVFSLPPGEVEDLDIAPLAIDKGDTRQPD